MGDFDFGTLFIKRKLYRLNFKINAVNDSNGSVESNPAIDFEPV